MLKKLDKKDVIGKLQVSAETNDDGVAIFKGKWNFKDLTYEAVEYMIERCKKELDYILEGCKDMPHVDDCKEDES